MMMTIKCPKCGVEGKMSLIERNYKGPYKCWSCRELFTIDIESNVVVSCQPLSQEEYEKAHPPKPTIDMNVGNARNLGGRRY
ncbi:MAG: hypothetical protein HYX80_01085 [Chloroflexi bacterium]|nr:hypothetical protein [Chloroflexota bacterium]